MYLSGEATTDISKKVGCCITTIYNVLKRNHIELKQPHKHNIEEYNVGDIISKYKNGYSVNKIEKETGVYRNKILEILKHKNINKISDSKRVNPNLNEDFFEEINTKEKAYWLGWLITDGNIDKHNKITITIKKDDSYILQQFEKDLGVTGHITKIKDKYSSFMLRCKKMKENLEKFGIIPNKTFSVTIPKLDESLMPSLLRGCIDGDGGISKTFRREKYEYELSFTGNKNCVETFNHFLSELMGYREKNVVKNGSVWRVRWSSKHEIVEILKVLYADSDNYRLERKFLFLNELINS